MNRLLRNDQLVLVVSTVLLGLLFVVLSEHGALNAALIGVAAGICAMSVRVRVLRRELSELRQRLETKQAHVETPAG